MKSKILRPLFSFVLGLCVVACATLTPAEQSKVAQDSIDLGMCAAEAHMCKRSMPAGRSLAPCWDDFDACMREHGYTDAAPGSLPPHIPAPFPTVEQLLPDPEDASATDAKAGG